MRTLILAGAVTLALGGTAFGDNPPLSVAVLQ